MPRQLSLPTILLALLLGGAAETRAQTSGEPPAERSILEGVYTSEQATRGAAVFEGTCMACHFPTEFKGWAFQQAWNGRPVSAFYDLVSSRMPEDNPGSLKRREYVDVIAYILQINAYPAGGVELPTGKEALERILIEEKPESGGR